MTGEQQTHAEQYEKERQEVLAWFERYDQLVQSRDLEAMADMAAFPINEVTDTPGGVAVAGPCDREKFIAQMRAVIDDGGQATMESVRNPTFFSSSLCFVVTDSTVTTDEYSFSMRYGDLLVRTEAGWQFQTMVAAGWNDQM